TCSTSSFARPDLAMLDRYLLRFFQPLFATHCNGTGLWACCSGCANHWIGLARAGARQANKMGVIPSLIRALAPHASDCRVFSVEFSLAAIVSFSSRDLRRRSFAPANGIIRLRRGYV